ncbi:DNA polymerase III subunit alpha [Candidatus Peribacteria bacterium]|nr:DNA polymerase III subunit alpha [Candidatus Peribacteria bacterium]
MPRAAHYVNLHTHSHYSFLRSCSTPRALLERAKELEMTHLALTDADGGYGLIDFYQAAKKLGIRPILGAEMPIAAESRYEQRQGIDGTEGHIVLLARDATGYQHLLELITRAHLEGYFHQPRLDMALLREYGEGLTVLTGSHRGEFYRRLHGQGEDAARGFLAQLQGAVGAENVYGELVARALPACEELNRFLLQLPGELPLVVTGDTHYALENQADACEALTCIASNELLASPHRQKTSQDAHLKSTAEIFAALPYVPEQTLTRALEQTLTIASSTAVELDFSQMYFPHVDLPEGVTAEQQLRTLCERAIASHYDGSDTTSTAPLTAIRERLDYELGVIGEMGFSAYFLIVEDFIRYAKHQGIAVGPGRGSAAGSIVSYLLDITTLDPLYYELLFERFLNPERVTMPDIDIDFSDERRHEVMHDYLIERYGQDYVSQVCTFGRLSAKAALKDIGRVMGIPFAQMNEITKVLPTLGLQLSDALDIEAFKRFYDASPALQKVYELALQVEGCIRQLGVHACAVIIAPDPMRRYTPLQRSPSDPNILITQYDYYKLEDMGMLKMDFLGLKNLSVIEKTLLHIEHTTGEVIDMTRIPTGDPAVFAMLTEGHTVGVFQFEAPHLKRIFRDLRPDSFEDLIAVNALNRPGPLKFVPDYIKRKHGEEEIPYPNPLFEPILQKTYGIAIYQEQILEIARQYAGFTLGAADILRRAIGKKKAELLAEQREKFINGAERMGHSREMSAGLFDDWIVPFASYGFNRSHSACYARIGYETAWLKAHYPVEFMAAMMTTDRDNNDRIVFEMHECQQRGITVLPPDVNSSGGDFTVAEHKGERVIRFGLTAIKGLGPETAAMIETERERHGAYTDIADFARRVPQKVLNKKTLEALIWSGALDTFARRGTLAHGVGEILSYAKQHHTAAETGQGGLFDLLEESPIAALELPEREATQQQVLAGEKQTLGMYVSDHPLRGYEDYFTQHGTLIAEITAPEESAKRKDVPVETIHGIITAVRHLTTKGGDAMAILTLEDMSGSIEVPVFPRVYAASNGSALEAGQLLQVLGKANERDGSTGFIAESLKVGSLEALKGHKVARAAEPQPLEKTPPEGATAQTADEKSGSTEALPQPETLVVLIPESASREACIALSEYLKTLESSPASHAPQQAVELHHAGRVQRLSYTIVPARGPVLERLRGWFEEGN